MKVLILGLVFLGSEMIMGYPSRTSRCQNIPASDSVEIVAPPSDLLHEQIKVKDTCDCKCCNCYNYCGCHDQCAHPNNGQPSNVPDDSNEENATECPSVELVCISTVPSTGELCACFCDDHCACDDYCGCS